MKLDGAIFLRKGDKRRQCCTTKPLKISIFTGREAQGKTRGQVKTASLQQMILRTQLDVADSCFVFIERFEIVNAAIPGIRIEFKKMNTVWKSWDSLCYGSAVINKRVRIH